MSRIEWTDETLNPVTGCTKVSQGCRFCYAERMAKRLQAMGQPNYANGFKVTLHPDVMQKALRWRKPRMVFVCSMSDLFHKDVPFDFIQSVFDVMAQTPQHTYQVLTKRPERMAEFAGCMVGDWPANVWAGTSVENRNTISRVNYLTQVPANVRFLSCEPLLGSLKPLYLTDIHWIIVGGESGPGARPMKWEWVNELWCTARHWDVPFFFKQWGGVNKKAAGRLFRDRTWDEMPQRAQPGAHVTQTEQAHEENTMGLTVNDFMTMPLKKWPQALQDYVIHVGKRVGHSGGVFSDCAEEYISAGYPDEAQTMIDAFDRRVNGYNSAAQGNEQD